MELHRKVHNHIAGPPTAPGKHSKLWLQDYADRTYVYGLHRNFGQDRSTTMKARVASVTSLFYLEYIFYMYIV